MEKASLAAGVCAWATEEWGDPTSPDYFLELFGDDGVWLEDPGYVEIEVAPTDDPDRAHFDQLLVDREDLETGEVDLPDGSTAQPAGLGIDRYGHYRSVEVRWMPPTADDQTWGAIWDNSRESWRRRRIGIPIDNLDVADELLFEVLDTPLVVGAYGIVDGLGGDNVRPFSWPLTFAVLPDADSAAFGDNLRSEVSGRWPELAQIVEVGSDSDEANILVLPRGEVPDPTVIGSFRASIVLFGGTQSEDKIAWAASIGAGAVGFVTRLTVERIVELVRNFGHDQPLDVAFWVPPNGDYDVVWNPESYEAGHSGDVLFADRSFIDRTHVANAFDRLALRVSAAESDFLMPIKDVFVPGGYLTSYLPNVSSPAEVLREVRPRLREAAFDAESDEGSESGEIAANIETALRSAGERPETRRLQVRLSAMSDTGLPEASTQLVRDCQNVVAARIAHGDVNWLVLDRDFPPDREPADTPYEVTLELRAPGLFDSPLVQTVEVPIEGPSRPVSFAFDVPDELGPHRIELIAWHRGRPVQRARLEGNAVNFADRNDSVATFEASDVRGFDFGLEGPDYLTVEVGRDDIRFVAAGIEVGNGDRSILDPYLTSVAGQLEDAGSYAIGAQSAEVTVNALRSLAYFGTLVRKAIFDDKPPDHRHVLVDATSQTPSFPIELLYDGAAPTATADLCVHWHAAAASGQDCSCDRTDTGVVCPLNFWALGRSLTRSVRDASMTPASRRTAMLRSGTCLYGVSKRVVDFDEDLVRQLRYAGQTMGHAVEATDWNSWVDQVAEHRPAVLVAVVHHADDNGIRALELRSDLRRVVDVNDGFVGAAQTDAGPLALLLGCTTSVTDSLLEHPVKQFSSAGSKVIFGTMSKVFPTGAVPAAVEILNRIGAGADHTVGDLGRSVRHELIAANNPVALTLCVHGDPEWTLT